MGVNIRLESPGNSHSTDLCSNHSYTLLCEWLEEHGDALAVLAKSGTYSDTEELAAQMERAYQESPPENPEVAHTADRLLDLLGGGNKGESLTIEM